MQVLDLLEQAPCTPRNAAVDWPEQVLNLACRRPMHSTLHPMRHLVLALASTGLRHTQYLLCDLCCTHTHPRPDGVGAPCSLCPGPLRCMWCNPGPDKPVLRALDPACWDGGSQWGQHRGPDDATLWAVSLRPLLYFIWTISSLPPKSKAM